jgi:hypothetical protein
LEVSARSDQPRWLMGIDRIWGPKVRITSPGAQNVAGVFHHVDREHAHSSSTMRTTAGMHERSRTIGWTVHEKRLSLGTEGKSGTSISVPICSMPVCFFLNIPASHDALTVEREGIDSRPSFCRQADLTPRCSSISAAFSRIVAFCIASARSSPGGILRASSRASAALMFSSPANVDWVLFLGPKKFA